LEAASLGLQTILIVRGTPDWAQKIQDIIAISQDKLQALLIFLVKQW
jgi:hypothetical protein